MIANLEAERAIIAAIVASPEAFWSLQSHSLDAKHFVDPAHRALFGAVRAVCESGKTHSAATIAAALPTELPDGKSTVATVAALRARAATEEAPAADFVEPFLAAFRRRELLRLVDEIRTGFASGDDVEDMAAKLDAGLNRHQEAKSTERILTIGEAVTAAVDETARRYQAYGGQGGGGYTTGIHEIDALMGPMAPGYLVTIGGASQNGKTVLVAQALQHLAEPSLDANQGGPTLLISMEMGGIEIARRSVAQRTSITTQRQRAGNVDVKEFDRIITAARALERNRMLIQDAGPRTMRQIERTVRAAKHRHGIVAFGVDHIREVLPENPRWSKIETVEDAIARTKRLAKDLGIVGIMLAQLTRDSQNEGSWRVKSHALWGGDRIKQASDVVLSVAIPTLWLAENQPDISDDKRHGKWLSDVEKWKGLAEVGLLKARDGAPGGYREVPFDGPRLWFGEEQIVW